MQILASDVIAAAALLVSLGSVIYIRQAVDAAKAANRINLHGPRAAIFQALFAYRRLFIALDLHPNDQEIDQFYVDAVLPAHIYLPSRFTDRCHEIYVRSKLLFERISECESGRSSESKWEHIHKLQNLGRTELDQLIRDVADEFGLGNT